MIGTKVVIKLPGVYNETMGVIVETLADGRLYGIRIWDRVHEVMSTIDLVRSQFEIA